jgi:hypothetical protein
VIIALEEKMDKSEIDKALQDILFDAAIIRHGFVPYLRDYEILLQILEQQLVFRFSHCVSATIETSVSDKAWRESWDDLFTNNEAWEKAGAPEGYLWAVAYASAYPGPSFVEETERAHTWSQRLGKQMWEVKIRTNAHNIELIFHDLQTSEIPGGDI